MNECKACGSGDVTVIETALDDGREQRLRVKCQDCGHTWWTLA